jgi:hypothetical protein
MSWIVRMQFTTKSRPNAPKHGPKKESGKLRNKFASAIEQRARNIPDV